MQVSIFCLFYFVCLFVCFLLHLSLPEWFPFFPYFGFLCFLSLQCLISALTRGAKRGYLFSLTCSVVMWRGSGTVNKCFWHVWRLLTVDGPHWIYHNPRHCAVYCHPAYLTYNAEYIMRNAGLEEAQAGIKIARRNINNVRYADDTTGRE